MFSHAKKILVQLPFLVPVPSLQASKLCSQWCYSNPERLHFLRVGVWLRPTVGGLFSRRNARSREHAYPKGFVHALHAG